MFEFAIMLVLEIFRTFLAMPHSVAIQSATRLARVTHSLQCERFAILRPLVRVRAAASIAIGDIVRISAQIVQ